MTTSYLFVHEGEFTEVPEQCQEALATQCPQRQYQGSWLSLTHSPIPSLSPHTVLFSPYYNLMRKRRYAHFADEETEAAQADG